MTFERHVNPRKQGDAGMGVAIGWFACNGYTVCVPLTDSQPYDLVVDNGTGLQRVAVRTTTQRKANRSYEVGLRTQGGNKSQSTIRLFDNSAVELLFVACDNGDSYLLPTRDITAQSSITVGTKRYAQYSCG